MLVVRQDIVVTTAFTSGYFRMLDYFTPNLARPRPDVVYGGTDDILDGAATEEAGVTYIKFRKPLFSNDSAGDYCLYPVSADYGSCQAICQAIYQIHIQISMGNSRCSG